MKYEKDYQELDVFSLIDEKDNLISSKSKIKERIIILKDNITKKMAPINDNDYMNMTLEELFLSLDKCFIIEEEINSRINLIESIITHKLSQKKRINEFNNRKGGF
jgi:hypothetical protein